MRSLHLVGVLPPVIGDDIHDLEHSLHGCQLETSLQLLVAYKLLYKSSFTKLGSEAFFKGDYNFYCFTLCLSCFSCFSF